MFCRLAVCLHRQSWKDHVGLQLQLKTVFSPFSESLKSKRCFFTPSPNDVISIFLWVIILHLVMGAAWNADRRVPARFFPKSKDSQQVPDVLPEPQTMKMCVSLVKPATVTELLLKRRFENQTKRTSFTWFQFRLTIYCGFGEPLQLTMRWTTEENLCTALQQPPGSETDWLFLWPTTLFHLLMEATQGLKLSPHWSAELCRKEL